MKEAHKIVFEGQSEEEKGKVEYCQDGIKPHMFKVLIGKDHPEFKTGHQQDACEYWQHLLDKMLRAEKALKLKSPGEVFDFE